MKEEKKTFEVKRKGLHRIERVLDIFAKLYVRYFNAIFGVIGFLLTGVGTYFGIDAYLDKKIVITEIPVGIGPFHTESREKFEMQHIYMFKEANDYLREIPSKYRIYPIVTKQDRYTELIYDLREGKTKISPIPPFTYLLYDNSLINTNGNSNVILIGYKRDNHKTIYNTRIIWNKNYKFTFDQVLTEIRKSVKNNSSNNNCKVIFTDEERSTSCHVVPEIFLFEHGINYRTNYHKQSNRRCMIDSITSNNKLFFVGFISSNDFEQLPVEKKDLLDYYEINIPIPFDVFLVNAKWWSKISSKEQQNIINSLERSCFGMISKDSNDTLSYRYDLFKLYAGSGIVYVDSINLSYIDTLVSLPTNRFDILKIRKKWNDGKVHNVKLVEFFVEDENANNSTLDTIILGKGQIIKKSDNSYKLTKCYSNDGTIINRSSLTGLHVID